MGKLGKQKRKNIYFRQTPKEFKSQRQTEVYYHINRNLPYTLFQFSKEKFSAHLKKVSNFVTFQKSKFTRKIRLK